MKRVRSTVLYRKHSLTAPTHLPRSSSTRAYLQRGDINNHRCVLHRHHGQQDFGLRVFSTRQANWNTSNSLKSSAPIARKKHEPLRILYFGSEEFSIETLSALHMLQQESPDIIESIDVVTRPPKRTGRGLQHIHEVPLAQWARDREHRVHQIDKFKDWKPPEYNLVIAVSFGLLIPAHIINSAKYGGLNVHPSLLPKYRGANPIGWALANNEPSTGVTVQTLHPTNFDAGQIILQTHPSIPINESPNARDELTATLQQHSKSLIQQTITHGLFLEPERDHTDSLLSKEALLFPRQRYTPEEITNLPRAPKVSHSNTRVNWTWPAPMIIRRQNLGSLWNVLPLRTDTVHDKQAKRKVTDNALKVIWKLSPRQDIALDPGSMEEAEGVGFAHSDGALGIRAGDGGFVWVDEAKVEGFGFKPAKSLVLKVGLSRLAGMVRGDAEV